MNNRTKCAKLLKNKQILSAVIWAVVILMCSYISKDSAILNILITGAGFHVVLLSRDEESTAKNKEISL